MDEFYLPGLPPVVQEAFRRLLNKGIKKRHLSQDVWEHEHKKEQITDFSHKHGIADIDYKVIDFYVEGDADTYYPVVIPYITAIRDDFPSAVHIEIVRSYNWTAPDSWNTPTHRGGLQVYIDTFLWRWGGLQYYMDIILGQTYNTTVADITVAEPDTSTIIIWLRGGHALYRLIAGTKIDISITPYIGDYKHKEGTEYETVYSPKTTVEEAFNYTDSIRKFSTISDQYIGGGYRNPKNGRRLATL